MIAGDDAAVRAIRMVEIPAADGYSPVLQSGRPGQRPGARTVYTQPGPLTQQPVTIALDDPMTVTYPPPS